KCSGCGARWTARPGGAGQPEPTAAPGPSASPPPNLDPPFADDIVVEGPEPELEPPVAARLAARRNVAPPAPAENRAWVWVVAKVAKPIDGRVPGGAVRHFAIAIVDPPANVRDLQVTFEPPAGASAKAAAPLAAEAVLAAPGVVDARPLPAGAPEALPPHD